jgi:CrcB protein
MESSFFIVIPRPGDQRIVPPPFRYYGAPAWIWSNAMMYLAVALGGALGSVARYAVSLGAARWLGAGFPWGTLIVNVAGSFAIGVLAALVTADGRPALGDGTRAFLMVGILGGFTTFSSFSLETLSLARAGAWGAAAGNASLSLLLCLGAVWLGFATATILNR